MNSPLSEIPNIEVILDTLSDSICIVDEGGEIRYVNPSFCDLTGYGGGELIGNSIGSFLLDTSFDLSLRDACRAGLITNRDVILLGKDGRHVRTLMTIQYAPRVGGAPPVFILSIRNALQIKGLNWTPHISAEPLLPLRGGSESLGVRESAEIERIKNQMDSILSAISDIVWSIEKSDFRSRYISPSVEDITGYSAERFYRTKRLWAKIIVKEDRRRVKEFFSNLEGGKAAEIEFRLRASSGDIRWMKVRAIYNQWIGSVDGVSYDITDERKSQEMIRYLAYHDPLTGLPNRLQLQKYLKDFIEKNPEGRMTVFFLDLDNFKTINDSLGHQIGDDLLIKLSERFTELFANRAMIARFGGDEFVILTEHANSKWEISNFATEILDAIRLPVTIQNYSFEISSSIGIAVYPKHGKDVFSMVRHADTAMYYSKERGKNRVAYYREEMEEEIREKLRIESIVRNAIEHGGYIVHYQPIINMKSGKIDGFEALLRIAGQDGQIIYPEKFIPVIENSIDLFDRTGTILMNMCCGAAQKMIRIKPDAILSINISARELQSINIVQKFRDCMDKYGIPPGILKIEITENAVMKNTDIAENLLGHLRQIGVTIAFDDFGTGYSSLQFLAKLPIDTIKIDRSFIMNMHADSRNRDIIIAVIMLGHSMGLDIVAEGIEEESQVEFLRSLQCDKMQGFYFARPVDVAEALRMLEENATYT